MSKHTKGPWEVHETEVYFPNCAGGLSVRYCPDAEANARLIAAAPCLLEALDSIIENGFSTSRIAAARAAIAKAKGEQE